MKTEESVPTIVVDAPSIQACLQQVFTPDTLQVIDESAQHNGHVGANGTGFSTHFRVRIASNKFRGLSRVQCHRLVYDSLRLFFDAGLHALAIEIQSPHSPTVVESSL